VEQTSSTLVTKTPANDKGFLTPEKVQTGWDVVNALWSKWNNGKIHKSALLQ
jgi:hypothetical protein